MIITIDGPAGAGKSTVAKALAKILNISYLDTGALYRAVTLKGMRLNLDSQDEEAWGSVAREANIELKHHCSDLQVLLDGEDISDAIRSDEVTKMVRYTAQISQVRECMVKLQRQMGKNQNLVGEGRDLGSVVFPDADYKFYLDADPRERAQRRAREMEAKGQTVDLQELEANMNERDTMDQTRAMSPLTKGSSRVVDSTGLTAEIVAQKMADMIKNG